VKGRKRHIVVDSQGSVLGVWVSPADVSDARGARVVLEQVLRRYPSAQVVIADGAYDKEGLLEWLLGEFCVALDCVFREGQGFVVLERRWLVERSFAWLLGCRPWHLQMNFWRPGVKGVPWHRGTFRIPFWLQ
jgi:putative transposase